MNKKRVIWIAVFLLIWQIVAMTKIINPILFPDLIQIGKALIEELLNGSLVNQVFFTLRLIFVSVVLSVVIAFILAFISIRSELFTSLTDTLTLVLHPLPGIALFPVLIGFVGINELSIILVIIHSVLWPLVLNLTTAYKTCPKLYLKIADNYELSAKDKFLKIYFPYGIPHFISGLKIGVARAFRAIISAEMVFGAVSNEGGLGYYIFTKRVFMNTAGMYAGLFVIIIIGILIEDVLFKQIEKNTVDKWGIYESYEN